MLQTFHDETKDQTEPAELTLDWTNELEVITLMLLRDIIFDFTVYLKLMFLLFL